MVAICYINLNLCFDTWGTDSKNAIWVYLLPCPIKNGLPRFRNQPDHSRFMIQLSKSEDIVQYDYTPIQYTVIFHGCNNDYFQMKNCDMFLTFAQTIIVGTRQNHLTVPHWFKLTYSHKEKDKCCNPNQSPAVTTKAGKH